MLTQQLVKVLTDIEVLGSCTLPVSETSKSTLDAVHQLSYIIGIWRPDWSPNYIFAKTAPNGRAHHQCTVSGLNTHNKIRKVNNVTTQT
jgi:hypothetical protein